MTFNRNQADEFRIAVENHIKEKGVPTAEVVPVQAGILVQAIIDPSQAKELREKILRITVELNASKSLSYNAVPFRIYTYKSPEDAFSSSGILRTKPHDYPDGIHTTYLRATDALFKMREIDADALSFGVPVPFAFDVRTVPPFHIHSEAAYAELDINGGHYATSSAQLKSMGENAWRLTLVSY